MTTFFCLSCCVPSASELPTPTVPCACGGTAHKCCARCKGVLDALEVSGSVCNDCLGKSLHRAKRRRRTVRHDALPRDARRFTR